MEEVAGFTHPREALEWVSAHPVDLALLDVEMPGMTGIELAAAIKERQPGTAIIFVTAYPKYAADALAVRASGYLRKPVTREALEADVAHALSDRRKPLEGHVTVHTFGGFDVLADGRAVDFRPAKCKEILAYLVDRQGGDGHEGGAVHRAVGGSRLRPGHAEAAGQLRALPAEHPAGIWDRGDPGSRPGHPARAAGVHGLRPVSLSGRGCGRRAELSGRAHGCLVLGQHDGEPAGLEEAGRP